MLFPFYSSQWETHPACSRESISGLCESSRRKSGLFSVADRCWAGLAKWRYNISLTLNLCEKSCFPKIFTRNKNIDCNLFRLPIRCISRDCEPRDELWLSWKWAPMLHPAAETWRHSERNLHQVEVSVDFSYKPAFKAKVYWVRVVSVLSVSTNHLHSLYRGTLRGGYLLWVL